MILSARVFWVAVVLALPAVILVLDYLLYRLRGNDATLSRTLLQVQSRWPLFAVCFAFDLGVLVGHLFVPQTIPAG